MPPANDRTTMHRLLRFETLCGAAARDAAATLAIEAFESEAWVDSVAAARRCAHRFVAVRAIDGRHAGACLFGSVHRRAGIGIFESMPMGGYGGWRGERALEPAEEMRLNQAWISRSPWWVVRLTGAPGREGSMPPSCAPTFLPAAWRRPFAARELTTHVVSLPGDDDALLARMRRHARSDLRWLDRSNVYAVERSGPDALREFCRLFREGSRQWKRPASELMPDAFFERLDDGGLADVWIARREGNAVAAALFLKGRTEVFFQASGTSREKSRVSGIDAIMWTAMRHYRDLGFRTLNLGASEGLESVRAFKEKLGGVASEYRQSTFLTPLCRRAVASA